MVSVAELIAESLVRVGVERVYGIIGTSVLDFYDVLQNYGDRLKVVTVRHEQSAVSAADAEFRAAGKLSAAIVHAGPGFLNTTIALGMAMKDRVPLLLISGGVKRRLRETDAWLEVNQRAIADGLVKAYEVVEDAGEVGDALSRAFEEMLSYPYGPAIIEVPEDVWREETGSQPPEVGRTSHGEVDDGEVKGVIEKMRKAERPVILACGELVRRSFSQNDLERVSEHLSAPVITSGNGRGALPENSPLTLGRVGFGGGNLAADRVFERADFVLVLGNELDDITTYTYTLAPQGDVVVVSEDPSAEVRPFYYELIRANPVAFLRRMAELCDAVEKKDEWLREVEGARSEWSALLREFSERNSRLCNPGKFFDLLDKRLHRDRVVVAGQGTHVIFANNNLRVFSPGSYLASTNLGAMGYALPAAIGAKLACPEKQVVCVAGDGEIMMTVQELETVRRENLDLKIVVVNDSSYRVLYLKQLLQKQGRVFQTLLSNPDFVRLAESFDIPATRVESSDGIEEAIEFLLEDGARMVELVIDRDEIPPLNLDATLRMGV
ncbi:thiamine pyrophosphate-binding protein [Geoglobus ahangari]